MSAAAVDWAFATDLPAGKKLNLVFLAWKADDQGVVYWGQKKIAQALGCDDRAVRGHLKGLAEAGAITRFHRHKSNGARKSDLIVLNMPRQEPIDLEVYQGVIGGRLEGDRVPTGVNAPEGPTGENTANLPAGFGRPTGENSPPLNNKGNNQQEQLGQDARAGGDHLFDVPKRPSFKIDRTAVSSAEWIAVEGIIDSFNEVFGTRFDPHGKDNVSKIVMRLREGAPFDVAAHRAVHEANAKAPWWGSEKPDTLGVVYSPKAWPRARRCDGVPSRQSENERVRSVVREAAAAAVAAADDDMSKHGF
jgi:hypothetical protein